MSNLSTICLRDADLHAYDAGRIRRRADLRRLDQEQTYNRQVGLYVGGEASTWCAAQALQTRASAAASARPQHRCSGQARRAGRPASASAARRDDTPGCVHKRCRDAEYPLHSCTPASELCRPAEPPRTQADERTGRRERVKRRSPRSADGGTGTRLRRRRARAACGELTAVGCGSYTSELLTLEPAHTFGAGLRLEDLYN
jgi:hypothetical protein